jgi:type VI protein secretion system component Hcp
MPDEQQSGAGDQQRPAAEEVEDLAVPAEEAEDVKGGLSDFHFTKKIDKSSPSLG